MKAIMKSLNLFLCFAVIILTFTSCEEPEPIVNSISERAANEIVVFLAGKGVRATKALVVSGVGGGSKVILWNIMVMPEDSVKAMAILNKVGLPRPPVKSLLEVFSSGGLVPSSQEQKIRYQAAIEEKIAGTIRKIDGVLSVDVQLSLPSEDSDSVKPSASVFVKHQGVMDDPNNQLNTKIKRLVSGSVDALDYDQVTVIADLARYAAVDLETKESIVSEEERNDYVGIWGIVVLKESVKAFRIVFFSAVIVLVAFLGMVLWMVWKTAPLVKPAGGFGKLLSFKPLRSSKKDEKGLKEEEEEEDSTEAAVEETSEEEGQSEMLDEGAEEKPPKESD